MTEEEAEMRDSLPVRARREYWCRECERWRMAETDHDDGRADDTWSCLTCGEPILCDECGGDWCDSHACPVEVDAG